MLKKSILKSFELSVIGNFSAAHSLRGYTGKCEELHGHNWKVELVVRGKKLNRIGLVEDFSCLKKLLNSQLEKFDHKYLNNIKPFDKINPTSENIAKYLFEIIYEKLKSQANLSIVRVTVWENEMQCASYGISKLSN
ncbi:MAG: 6-carboxytetrahydropterin synthase QueD [Elusimicrobiota bacterium]|nr:6-carboxytetrahydropterin synthase QueD [Elusimicrobiota bacterium]